MFIFWRVGEGKEGEVGRFWVRMRAVKRDWGENGCFGGFFFKRWRELNYGHFLRVSVFPT